MKKATVTIMLLALCLNIVGCSAPNKKTEQTSDVSLSQTESDVQILDPLKDQGSQAKKTGDTSATALPSESAKELGGYNNSYIESVINEDFKDLTQEQFYRIALYKSEHDGRHPYNEAVAAGLIDSDSPKITREKIQEIIQEALNKDLLPDNTKFSIENSDGEIFSYYNSADPKCFFGYILNEAKKIQPYYDETTDNTYDKYYYPVTDENGNPTEAIKITIDSTKGTIQYIRLNEKGDDGKSKKEILYES